MLDNDLLGAILRTVRGSRSMTTPSTSMSSGTPSWAPGTTLVTPRPNARMKTDYVYPDIADRRSISEWQMPVPAMPVTWRAIGCARYWPATIRATSTTPPMRRSGPVTTSFCRATGCRQKRLSGEDQAMQTHANVVIIGGGMMGVGLAYHLALEGWTDVLLIEKGRIDQRSTWHAAGQCPSFIGNTTWPRSTITEIPSTRSWRR